MQYRLRGGSDGYARIVDVIGIILDVVIWPQLPSVSCPGGPSALESSRPRDTRHPKWSRKTNCQPNRARDTGSTRGTDLDNTRGRVKQAPRKQTLGPAKFPWPPT